MKTLALLAALIVALPFAADMAAAPQVSLKTFEATARPHRIETDLPPDGRIGNRDLLHWVINDRYGRPFGIATLTCDWFQGHERMCHGVFRLARGSFAVTGTSFGRSFGEFFVIAGTGDYTTSRGTLHFNATARDRLTLRGLF